MPGITFDTSVFVSYKPVEFPAGFLMSAVVIQEILAAAVDETELRRWSATFRAYEGEGRLIVPTSDDWLMAGKVLCWLARGRKKSAGGKSPRRVPEAKQRMAYDTLIAVSARRVGATVVTVNWDDFRAIQYYCDVKVQRASDFFRQSR
jgi:predicted nucleic acid-binding protein